MEETMFDANQELKRVDHLIYVSLKYTRTADVLKNVIERLLSAYDNMVLALLRKAQEDEKLNEVSHAPIRRYEQLREIYPEDDLIEHLASFTQYLRRLSKLDYGSENEYRRHVAMIFNVDGEEKKINIDEVTKFYKKAKELHQDLKSRFEND
ncbi:MAG: hypothetical protein ACQESF_00580 [Nanobdellota archaeon]